MICYHFDDQAAPGRALHVSFLDLQSLSHVALPHTHDHFEIFLMLEGRARHLLNGREESLCEGTLCLLRPEDVHGFADLSGEIRCVNVVFRPGCFETLIDLLGGESLWRFLDGEGKRMLLSPPVVRCLMDAAVQASMYPEEEPQRLLMLALGQAILSGKLSRRQSLPLWLEEVVHKYQFPERFTRPIDQLYALCGRSREHVCRCFRRYLGMTPTQFINDLRLSHAHYLLRTTQRTVVEISLLCGFESLSHFNHLFRERYGDPPSKCR